MPKMLPALIKEMGPQSCCCSVGVLVLVLVLVLGKCSMWPFGFENLIGNIAEHIPMDLYVHSSLTLIICLKHGPSKMVPSHAHQDRRIK
jgi:hypothetical protein